MPPKKGKARMKKRKNLGESTTKVNNQSESRDCPVSTRRRLNLDSTMISDLRRTLRSSGRRCSLRSSKMPVETGTTSLSRCSRPHISRGHSAAPDDIQQLDIPAQTIKTAYQVPEESSHQIADPPTLEPELGHKEAENVEYSTVGGREMMDEEDKAEISPSNHSSLMVRKNTFEEERIPMVEEVTNENHMKCISRTGCSSPSFSLKLTKLVSMAGAEDDEVDSEMQSQPEDMVNIYQVKPEFMSILRKIIGKHGDITKNCVTKSVKFRSAFLDTICEIISDLDKKDIANIKGNDLKIKIGDVNDIKNLKVEVEWLHTRLTEILEARQILKKSGTLKEKKDSIRKFIEIAEGELKECEVEKKKVSEKLKELSEKLKAICDKEADWKERLTRMQDESTKTSQRVKDVKSKVRRFVDCSLIDGLL